MHLVKILYIFDTLTNHLILTKMKKLKLIFGLLMLSAFVAVTVLSYTANDDQAIRKSRIIIPRNG